MKNVVVTGCPRADPVEVASLAEFGVATVHEATAATARAAREDAARAAFRQGELGLDRYGLRGMLSELGVEYVDYAESVTP